MTINPKNANTTQDPALPGSDPLLRDAEGAQLLGCSKATWWRRVADGTLPGPLKIGGLSRWKLSEVLAVIECAASKRADSV